jgi:hypothetical protein
MRESEIEREREKLKSWNHQISQQCGSRKSPLVTDGGDPPSMEGPEI